MEVVGPGGVPQFAVQPLNCLPASAPGTLKSGNRFIFQGVGGSWLLAEANRIEPCYG